jgi:hypothetical protein
MRLKSLARKAFGSSIAGAGRRRTAPDELADDVYSEATACQSVVCGAD